MMLYGQLTYTKSSFLIVDGSWSPFDNGICSGTCGEGTLIRTRKCNNPAPANGGKKCRGLPVTSEPCTVSGCPGERQVYSSLSQ